MVSPRSPLRASSRYLNGCAHPASSRRRPCRWRPAWSAGPRLRDQVAGGDQCAADAAVDGRRHASEGRVSWALSGCAWIAATADFASLAALAGIGQFGGDRILLPQTLTRSASATVRCWVARACCSCAPADSDLGLERARVDLEQEIAFLHQRTPSSKATLSMKPDTRGRISTDSGASRAAGELVPLGHRLFDDLGDADGGWWHARLGGLRALPRAVISTATAMRENARR